MAYFKNNVRPFVGPTGATTGGSGVRKTWLRPWYKACSSRQVVRAVGASNLKLHSSREVAVHALRMCQNVIKFAIAFSDLALFERQDDDQ